MLTQTPPRPGRARSPVRAPEAGPAVPRLLHGLGPGPISLAAHRAVYPTPPRRSPSAYPLIEAVEAAGLRGRGGAGFPTGRKLRAVADARRAAVMVVNGTEGEPPSAKDKLLLAHTPHLVLDGAAWAAVAVGATEVIMAIERGLAPLRAILAAAVAERSAEGGVAIRVEEAPARYVSGEERALVRWLNGGPAQPPAGTIRPFQRGVAGRPTLIDNTETVVHLAQIARWGPRWFREVGTAEEPGSALATVTAGTAAQVIEAELGTPLAKMLGAVGADAASSAGVLVGGYFGSWLTATEAASRLWTDADLAGLDASVGCGVVLALPPDGCPICETARILTWLGTQTAGQCGPCVRGVPALARLAETVARGAGQGGDADVLARWADQVDGRGGCRFPDGAARLLRSALRAFPTELEQHLTYRRCPRSGARFAPIPARPAGWR